LDAGATGHFSKRANSKELNMPELRRAGKPTLYYALDDYTDPWRHSPYLILQHGYGRSGQFWYSWVPYLSRFYKIVRPDLRGLGQSGVPDDLETGLNVEAYIDDLLAIIGELGGGPIHYCGESLGGILGMVLAAQHPQRLRTLSLVAAPLLINKDTQRAFAFDYPTWQDALRTMGSNNGRRPQTRRRDFLTEPTPACSRGMQTKWASHR
jgi:3-oxoadipate enol-lactonase